MRITVPIHSMVDVITNSSSVIYTEAKENSVELAKEIFNSILKAGGSEATADDLFDFSTQVLPVDGLGTWLYYDEDDFGRPDHIQAIVTEAQDEVHKHESYKDRIAAADAVAEKYRDELFAYFNDLGVEWDCYPRRVLHLVVKTKDGKTFPFAENVLALFNQDASYDG